MAQVANEMLPAGVRHSMQNLLSQTTIMEGAKASTSQAGAICDSIMPGIPDSFQA